MMAKINGTVIYLDDRSPYYGSVYLLDNSGSVYDAEKTSIEGKFTFQNVVNGTYTPGSSKNKIIQPVKILIKDRDKIYDFIMSREALSRGYIYVPVAIAMILAGIDRSLFNDWVIHSLSVDEIIAKLRKVIYKKAQYFDTEEEILKDRLKYVLINPRTFNLDVYLEKMQNSEQLIIEEKYEESGIILEELANAQIEFLNITENKDDRKILSSLIQDVLYRASCSYRAADLSEIAGHIYERSLDYLLLIRE